MRLYYTCTFIKSYVSTVTSTCTIHDTTLDFDLGPRSKSSVVSCMEIGFPYMYRDSRAYEKAGNGNEMETGNENWKWKLETETGNRNVNKRRTNHWHGAIFSS